MPTRVGILMFMSMINFMLSWVEHEIIVITSRPCEDWTGEAGDRIRNPWFKR